MSKKFTFIDFFSGVGGFRVAAEKNGGTSIGFSEVDKPAIAVYEKNFRTSLTLSLSNAFLSSAIFLPQQKFSS